MKTKQILNILLGLLGMHLLYSNTELLLQLVGSGSTWYNVLSRLVFALSYSAMTVLIIMIYPRWYVFTLSAMLDATAVWLKYFDFASRTTFVHYASLYFALYTAFVVIVSGLISKQLNDTDQTDTASKVDYSQLRQEKISIQRRLARLKDQQKRQAYLQRLQEIEKVLGS